MRILFLDGGRLRLDGGAMFGIIPKPLWSRLVTPDEQNRVSLATTCMLIETPGRRILVECGIGNKYGDKDRAIFAFSNHWLIDSLSTANIDPDSIDLVILTHLHFDHAGGLTTNSPHGPVPTYPRARVAVQRGEWDDARLGHSVMTGTYRTENLAPFDGDDRLLLIDGPAELAPGISVQPLPGHTRHQQAVIIRAGGQTLFQTADLMPTAAHRGLRYNMAYDLDPYGNMVNKERMLTSALSENWTLVLGQDPDWPTWRPAKSDRFVELKRAE